MMTSFSIAVHSIMGQFEALISCHDFLNSITARTKNSQFFCYHPSHSLRSDDDLWRSSDISAAASAAHRLLRATWDALGKVSAIASRSAFLSLCLKCIKTRFSFLYYLFFFVLYFFTLFFVGWRCCCCCCGGCLSWKVFRGGIRGNRTESNVSRLLAFNSCIAFQVAGHSGPPIQMEADRCVCVVKCSCNCNGSSSSSDSSGTKNAQLI